MEIVLLCLTGIVVFLVLLLLAAVWVIRRYTVLEHERGLLYRRGRFQRVLDPGDYWLARWTHTVRKVDMRVRFVTLPGQEVLTADNVGIRMSLVASYRIADPFRAIHETENFFDALYLLIQLQLRDIVGTLEIDDLLARRGEMGDLLHERSAPQIEQIGLTLLTVGIKDIMFPGELKQIFAQIVNARKEGQAALERARGESAALRNLANAAKLLENNPALLQLRILQALSGESRHTVVWGPDISLTGTRAEEK